MPHIVSIASGKGGVGKSVVAANLSLLLAKRGRRVILADLDLGGADSHILFGLINPPLTLTDFLSRRVATLAEVAQPLSLHKNLRIIPGTGETLATANLIYAKKKRLIRHFRELDTDVIVVDIGAGTSYHTLDFFLMADHHITVATPDPTSIMDLYRFIKLAAIRRVLSSFVAKEIAAEGLSDRDYCSVEEVLDAAGKTDEGGRRMAEMALASFRPALILNRVAGRSRVNVLQLRQLLKEYVGGDLTLLGEIPDDSAMDRAVRGFLPITENEPAAPSAVALSRIADAFLPQLTSPPHPRVGSE